MEVRRVLAQFGQSTEALMKDSLSEVRQRRTSSGRLRSLRTNAVASGALLSSITYRISWEGGEYLVEFSMLERGDYVDLGTRPSSRGAVPGRAMITSLREWCGIKGIDPAAAWPIAVSILKNGQAARPFFPPRRVTEQEKQSPAATGEARSAALESLAAEQGLPDLLAEAYARDFDRWLSGRR